MNRRNSRDWADMERGALLLLLFTLLLTGCGDNGPLREAVNARFPPVNSIQNQLAATRTASQQLSLLATPNVYAAVSGDDLKDRLPRSLKAKLKDDGSQTLEVDDIEVALGKQEVVVRADFDVELKDQAARALGTAEVHCAAAVESSALVLRPSVTGLTLHKLAYKGNETADVLVSLINQAVQPFLDNLNGAIQAQVIPLAFYHEGTIDLEKEIQDQLAKASATGAAEGVTLSNFKASKVHVHIALGRASVLVDPEGVHVLGEIVSLNPDLASRTLAELKTMEDSGSITPFTSSQLAYLAGCPADPDDPGLPPADSPLEVEHRSVCRSLRPKILMASPSAKAPEAAQAQQELATAFPAFKALFLEKTAIVEKPDLLPWPETAVAISRPAFAQIFNDVLHQITIRADLGLPDFQGAFQETLRTEPAPDLKCAENAGGCDSDFSYPPYNPRGCDSDCTTQNCGCVLGICGCVPGVDLNCQGRKIDCERIKEQERVAYETGKGAAQAAWIAKKNACELLKEAKKKGCDINQGWLNTVGDMDVGGVRGSWSAQDPRVQFYLGDLSLASAFTGINARMVASGSTRLKADFRVTPHNAGTIACFKEFDGSISATASVVDQDLNLSASLTKVEPVDEELRFTFTTAENAIRVNTSPPPLVALFDQNAGTLVTSCPVPTAVAAGIAGTVAGITPVNILATINIAKTVNNPTVEIKLKPAEYTAAVKPFEIDLGKDESGREQKIAVAPSWHESSVVFRRN